MVRLILCLVACLLASSAKACDDVEAFRLGLDDGCYSSEFRLGLDDCYERSGFRLGLEDDCGVSEFREVGYRRGFRRGFVVRRGLGDGYGYRGRVRAFRRERFGYGPRRFRRDFRDRRGFRLEFGY